MKINFCRAVYYRFSLRQSALAVPFLLSIFLHTGTGYAGVIAVQEATSKNKDRILEDSPTVLVTETDGEISKEYFVIAENPGGAPYRDERKNTIKHGAYIEYKRGYLSETGFYRFGRRHGPYTRCDSEDCTQKTITAYSEGKKYGYELRWRGAGKLSGKTYYQNDLKAGIEQIWREDGGLSAECNYRYGKKHGYCRRWYENGRIENESEWLNGNKNGPEREWAENGQLLHETNWVNGSRNGLERKWYDDGTPQAQEHFEDNSSVGEHVEYYPSGKLKYIGHDEEGKTLGTWYDEDGNVTSEYTSRGTRVKDVFKTIGYPVYETMPVIMPGVTGGFPFYMAAILDLWLVKNESLKSKPATLVTFRPGWSGVQWGVGEFIPFWGVKKITLIGVSLSFQAFWAWKSTEQENFYVDYHHMYMGPDLGFHISAVDIRFGALFHTSDGPARQERLFSISAGISFMGLFAAAYFDR